SLKVIDNAKQIMEMDPIFLDTETTGFGPNDVIIEIGIVDLRGKVLFESLFKPSLPIPSASSSIHGITDEMVTNAPSWKDAWSEIENVLKGRIIGMYNADFDLRLMKQTHQRYWLDWDIEDKQTFCVMKLFAAFYGDWNPRRNSFRLHKLENAGRMSSILLPNSHRAVDDARLTAALTAYIAGYTPNQA
ncbi:MAG: 3'-5' exonuclease, partial [Chloroflexota bacterium]